MSLLGHLFGHDTAQDALLPAIERAISSVEPLLKQARGYPENYRIPVRNALQYAHHLAASVPGPVLVNRESYVKDAFVHALFPSADAVVEMICASHALQDYKNKFPATDELYAMMGMRLFEKTTIGVDLAGEVVQRDVVQKVVYFTGHTLESPAPSEEQSRDRTAWSFFDSLMRKVKERVETRKHEKHLQLQQKDRLIARLRVADAQARPALRKELAEIFGKIQAATLELNDYTEDFEAVLLNPESHLRLAQTPMILDGMGIRRESGDAAIEFSQLMGYDRRDWVLTMVHCNKLQCVSFAERLDKAYRKLSL